MPEEVVVVVASEQIDVLAPPAEMRISVGVGAAGQRGSRFYAGTQSAEAFYLVISETPSVFDLYLNTTTQQMWQFVSTPTGNVWSMLFDLSTLLSAAAVPAVEAAIDTTLSKWLILGPTDPIPVGTPANMVIFRTAG